MQLIDLVGMAVLAVMIGTPVAIVLYVRTRHLRGLEGIVAHLGPYFPVVYAGDRIATKTGTKFAIAADQNEFSYFVFEPGSTPRRHVIPRHEAVIRKETIMFAAHMRGAKYAPGIVVTRQGADDQQYALAVRVGGGYSTPMVSSHVIMRGEMLDHAIWRLCNGCSP